MIIISSPVLLWVFVCWELKHSGWTWRSLPDGNWNGKSACQSRHGGQQKQKHILKAKAQRQKQKHKKAQKTKAKAQKQMQKEKQTNKKAKA